MVYNFLKNKIWWNEARRNKNPTKCVKSNLNEKSRGRYKSKEQKCTLENIKLLYESRQAVIQKTAEATGDSFRNKIAYKIMGIS